MWLLENAGNAFQGRRLWLRPGKRYIFGRTRAEPGQLVISDKTISRKHLTIEIGPVGDNDGSDVDARSAVTVEDLATKIGTVINGTTQIRGTRHVLTGDRTTIKMGHMADLFSISWQPVVFSFSFTSKELRATAPDDPQNPWTRLHRDLGPLDIKFVAEFRAGQTTHVVAKKRNTSRGLQALVSGAYIVSDSFLDAVVAAAGAADGALESDWDAAWPSALDHLPPRGDEPSNRPSSIYAPDPRRANIFEGYTFVFYDQKQYDNLLPPISSGRGKALLPAGADAVVPNHTQVDDFVRFVKGVAGEPGMGEFEDGSAGRGVVVVRYVPAKGDHVAWFTRFTTAVALRLDHRLIDQREFLDAILAVEPSMLRRPLEVEEAAGAAAMDVDVDAAVDVDADANVDGPQRPPPPSMSMSQASTATRRARGRRGVTTSRFKGFDADLESSDIEDDLGTNALAALDANVKPSQSQAYKEDDNMFVSQPDPTADVPQEQPTRRSKRGAAAARAAAGADDDDNDDVMDDIAPTAAAVKRRRIEAGHEPVPRMEDSDKDAGDDDADLAVAKKAVAIKQDMTEADILNQARRNREAAEQKLAAERARLAELPDDGLDAEAIRKLTLVETIEVRMPTKAEKADKNGAAVDRRTADGRWNPEWNGRRNFKKFRRQGDVVGRPPPRVIVGLEPAKTKEYGIGDGYWLEGGDDRPEHRQNTANAARNGRHGTPGVDTSALLTPADVLPVRDTRSAASRSNRSTSMDADAASAGAASVDMEVVPDTDPEDGGNGGDDDDELAAPVAAPPQKATTAATTAATTTMRPTRQSHRQQQHHPSLDNDAPASTMSSTTSPRPSADLPRTRAGKVGVRTAVARQTQAASQARAAATTPSGGGTASIADPLSMTSSSLVVFDTPPPSTQASSSHSAAAAAAAADTRAGRGAKRPTAGAAAAPPPAAKRPRRGAAGNNTATSHSSGTAASGSASAAIAIHDGDSDEDDGLKFKFRSRR
ncbi:hypothetical protein HMPREF1624_03883 [Sporothrix schenckii ATCC 58251]|uniref:FHA domain-containing protein n=1 Tax=Sporothrix schenckii (strain ATCC 58251 / de Perez 2211183) TaxID=1391915 RepID=U7Q0J8_SPOS1|nr:hypothetical protein HMPREF1624_03883 [Sporothrix schenckii ATCC 58251]